MCMVILQYIVPCLFLKYMKPVKPVWQHCHNTEEFLILICVFLLWVIKSDTFSLNPRVKTDLSVCPNTKHVMLSNPSDMFAWAYSLLISKNKRVQLIQTNQKIKTVYYYTHHTREGFWSQSTTNFKQEIGKNTFRKLTNYNRNYC